MLDSNAESLFEKLTSLKEMHNFRGMFRRPKQHTFFKPTPRSFGGDRTKGSPREARPITIRSPIHLVMRSGHAKLLRIRIYDYANVGNHLHMTLLFPSRKAYYQFIRTITGLVVRVVTGCERGQATALTKFWDARPYTRIVSWGREMDTLKRYFRLNRLEAIGFGRELARTIVESSV